MCLWSEAGPIYRVQFHSYVTIGMIVLCHKLSFAISSACYMRMLPPFVQLLSLSWLSQPACQNDGRSHSHEHWLVGLEDHVESTLTELVPYVLVRVFESLLVNE